MGVFVITLITASWLLNGVTSRYVDLTHDLHNTTIGWPGRQFTFNLNVRHAGPYGHLPWMAENDFQTPEHMSTHMDSPYHINKNGEKIDEIPFDRLHGPGVVINIAERAKHDKNAKVMVSDLLQWEARNGRIPDGAHVLMSSGWDQYWGDQLAFVGSYNDTKKLNYPGFSGESARWLIENRPLISAIGVDTVSCDFGSSTLFEAHVLLLSNRKMCIEMVANLDKIPESGTHVFALPMKIRGGTGAPVRMYAVWDEHLGTGGSQKNHMPHLLLVAIVFTLKLFI